MADALIPLVAVLAGTAFAWWLRDVVIVGSLRATRDRIGDLQHELGEERRELEAVRREYDRLAERLRSETERRPRVKAGLVNERKVSTEKLDVLKQAETALANAFNALSAKALEGSNRAFLEQRPLRTAHWPLRRVD